MAGFAIFKTKSDAATRQFTNVNNFDRIKEWDAKAPKPFAGLRFGPA